MKKSFFLRSRLFWGILAVLFLGGIPAGKAELQKVPSFIGPNFKGGKVYFYPNKLSNPVLLFFWHSTSKPCLKILPNLNQLAKENEGNLSILGINLDRKPQEAKSFIHQRGISFANVKDPQHQVAKRFQVNTIPRLILIDWHGNIKYNGSHFNDLKVQANKILDDSPQYGVSYISSPKHASSSTPKTQKKRNVRSSSPYPSFRGDQIDGGSIYFDPNRLRKPALLVFWATWCGPCRRKIPELMQLHRQEGNQLDILGISVDRNPAKLKSFVKEKGIAYPNIIDSKKKISHQYKIGGIPQLILFDDQGKVSYRGNNLGKRFQKALQRILD